MGFTCITHARPCKHSQLHLVNTWSVFYLEKGKVLQLVLQVCQGMHAGQKASRPHAHAQQGVHAWGKAPRMRPRTPSSHLLHLSLHIVMHTLSASA